LYLCDNLYDHLTSEILKLSAISVLNIAEVGAE